MNEKKKIKDNQSQISKQNDMRTKCQSIDGRATIPILKDFLNKKNEENQEPIMKIVHLCVPLHCLNIRFHTKCMIENRNSDSKTWCSIVYNWRKIFFFYFALFLHGKIHIQYNFVLKLRNRWCWRITNKFCWSLLLWRGSESKWVNEQKN